MQETDCDTCAAAEDAPWEPEPIPAEDFHAQGEININRAPYDQISGVTYKRAANIKRVRYAPLDAAPEMLEPWQGHGTAIVRWLFSERAGSAEQLLDGATFAFLHDVRLLPGASTGQRAHPGEIHVLYVIAGNGMLHHRPDDGSPVIARPLRPGDAVVVRSEELYCLSNPETEDLWLLVLGLRKSGEF
ncbi:MAG: cupin domain-containing protein [Anaerolineae bacterium]|nr:cupin domain-containing protein [Anaerolineae bacterium]